MRIDLNADLGESYGPWQMGDDMAMLDIVTSANIACGFHGGDPSTMARVCAAAVERGVVLGAHVSYPDLAGFGRRFIDMAPAELRDAVLYQLGALRAFAGAVGSTIDYIKPHGALYHAMSTHPDQAEAVLAAILVFDRSLVILGDGQSRLAEFARSSGITVVAEAFADRAYRPDGSLVPRVEPGAVLDDPEATANQALGIATNGSVTGPDGTSVGIRAGSICLHGDTPGSVSHAWAVRRQLERSGVTIAPFIDQGTAGVAWPNSDAAGPDDPGHREGGAKPDDHLTGTVHPGSDYRDGRRP